MGDGMSEDRECAEGCAQHMTDAPVPACLFCCLSQKPPGPLRHESSSPSQHCNSHAYNPDIWLVSHLSR